MRSLVVAIALCSLTGAVAAESKKEPRYHDECRAHFREDPLKARKNRSAATELIATADEYVSFAGRASDFEQIGTALIDAVHKYKRALYEDPYNAEATLKLALAYDRLYRKGCALALLKRLEALNTHPKLAGGGALKRVIDSIDDNPSWFKAYRKEAMAAIGH